MEKIQNFDNIQSGMGKQFPSFTAVGNAREYKSDRRGIWEYLAELRMHLFFDMEILFYFYDSKVSQRYFGKDTEWQMHKACDIVCKREIFQIVRISIFRGRGLIGGHWHGGGVGGLTRTRAY